MTTKQFEKLQKQLGFSDAELAEQLDVDRATVWRWKSDKKRIDKVTELALLYLQSQSTAANSIGHERAR